MGLRHRLGRDDAHLDQLAAELAVALGRPVALTVDHLPAGAQLTMVDERTGVEVDVDEAVVAAVIAAHVPPVPPPPPAARLAADLEAATTLAQLRAALLGWAREEAGRVGPTAPPMRGASP